MSSNSNEQLGSWIGSACSCLLLLTAHHEPEREEPPIRSNTITWCTSLCKMNTHASHFQYSIFRMYLGAGSNHCLCLCSALLLCLSQGGMMIPCDPTRAMRSLNIRKKYWPVTSLVHRAPPQKAIEHRDDLRWDDSCWGDVRHVTYEYLDQV